METTCDKVSFVLLINMVTTSLRILLAILFVNLVVGQRQLIRVRGRPRSRARGFSPGPAPVPGKAIKRLIGKILD